MIIQFKLFHGCLNIVQILAPGREFAPVKSAQFSSTFIIELK